MTALSKTDRQAVVGAALKASFEPRFHALNQRMTEHLRQYQQESHPEFIKLTKDPNALPYLQYQTACRFYVPAENAGYNAECGMPKIWHEAMETPYRICSGTNASSMFSRDLMVTSKIGTSFTLRDETIIADYRQLWEDLLDAKRQLEQLLYSYRNREKFTEAFPELAKHLPPAKTPARLPAVIIEDVRAKLAKLSIAA